MGRVSVDCLKAPTGYDLSCCCTMPYWGQQRLLGIVSCHTNLAPHYALSAWRSWEADKFDRPDTICRECRPVEYSVCRTYKAKTDSRAATSCNARIWLQTILCRTSIRAQRRMGGKAQGRAGAVDEEVGLVPEQWSSGAVAVCVSCPLKSVHLPITAAD